jgi:nucleotide-binding universal stress UspA family protein
MTSTTRSTSDPLPTGSWLPAPPRLIAVGVRGYGSDASALAWALDDATDGRDRLYVVHAYVPLRIEGCHWPPVSNARDARRDRARRVVASALQRVRVDRGGLDVDGSAVAGLPDDVLVEFSEVVDLVVVGEDEIGQRSAKSTVRRILQSVHSPVAVVPGDYASGQVDSELPVTVVVDTLDLPSHLLEAGLQEATRRHTTLRVAHAWSSLNEEGPWTAQLLANRQAQLDMQLSDWHGSRPSGGIVGELLVDDGPEALTALRVNSQLLVVSRDSPRLLGRLDPVEPGRCPALILPDVIGT